MKSRFGALLFLLLASGPFAGPALADARQDVMLGAQRCANIPDDRTWLDCYYGAAQPLRSRLGLPPAPVNQQRLVPPAMGAMPPPAYAAPTYAPYPAAPAYAPYPAAPAYAAPAIAAAPAGPPPLPRPRTGVLTSLFGTSKPVVSNQRMEKWGTGRNGRFTVTLMDGEIWMQNEGDNGAPNWRDPVSRYVVNIYQGALGTYNMTVSDDSTLYKVHRIN